MYSEHLLLRCIGLHFYGMSTLTNHECRRFRTEPFRRKLSVPSSEQLVTNQGRPTFWRSHCERMVRLQTRHAILRRVSLPSPWISCSVLRVLAPHRKWLATGTVLYDSKVFSANGGVVL